MSSFTGDVPAWVKEPIDSAALLVADLSGGTPNLYLEVGDARGHGCRPSSSRATSRTCSSTGAASAA